MIYNNNINLSNYNNDNDNNDYDNYEDNIDNKINEVNETKEVNLNIFINIENLQNNSKYQSLTELTGLNTQNSIQLIQLIQSSFFNRKYSFLRELLKYNDILNLSYIFKNFNYSGDYIISSISLSQIPNDIMIIIKPYLSHLLPFISSIEDYILFYSHDISFISSNFNSILRTNNYELIEYILMMTIGSILPITGIYNGKVLINDIHIIKLLEKYSYFNHSLLTQKISGKTFISIFHLFNTNVIDYILLNIYPLYHFGSCINLLLQRNDIKLTTILIKHGLKDLYQYYIAQDISYKLSLICYDINNIEGYKITDLIVKQIVGIRHILRVALNVDHIIKIISFYIDPEDDKRERNELLEIERNMLIGNYT